MLHQFLGTHPTTHALSFLSAHEHNQCTPSRNSDVFHTLFLEREIPFQRSLPPIFAVLEVLDNYPLFNTVLASFPPHIHYAIKASLLASDPYQSLRLQVLEKLVYKNCSLSTVVQKADPIPLSLLLQHECVFGVIEGMLADSGKYRRELAFLFTQLSMYQLPPYLQKIVTSSAKHSLTILPAYLGWGLCSAAERRLLQAMQDHAVLLVNETLLLKFNGKLSGLALQTTLLEDGTQLLEGCWYAPIDHRDEIRDAFDRGESRLCVDGQWTLIRALDEENHDTLLQRAQTYAATLPDQLPQQIANTTRQTYRNNAHEGF